MPYAVAPPTPGAVYVSRNVNAVHEPFEEEAATTPGADVVLCADQSRRY
jgi:hypothetical protein